MTLPHVTLKLATSLDGRIAMPTGESRWITGPEARAETHKLRAASDAVMVGAGSASADDPELTARTEPPPPKQPLRVILDSSFSLSLDSKLVKTARQVQVLVVGAEGADPERQAALEAAGVTTALVRSIADGVDPTEALKAAGERGVRRVLAEGGGRVAASLLRAGLVARIEWMRAPIVIGDEGVPAIGVMALSRLAQAPAFRRVAVRELGPDLWESYERA